MWKKPAKKPVQLCSKQPCKHVGIAKHVEALRPDMSPPPSEPGVKQKYSWEKGQLGLLRVVASTLAEAKR